MNSDRHDVMRRVAALLGEPARPLLVAVDGGDGAGKTWFADELAEVLRSAGMVVVRAGVDDFHQPREFRHASGRTGEAVWQRHFDYRALRRELLDPWRAGSGATYRRRWHDLTTDELVDDRPEVVPDRGVLVFDGVFAQRPELARFWDLAIWIEAPVRTRVTRLAERDKSPDDPAHPDQARYLDAQRIYRAACDPAVAADVVVDNDDLEQPVLRLPEVAPTCPACGRRQP